MTPFRLGTRGSPLALTQARMVADALCAAHGWAADRIETVVIRTTGDRVQDRPLAEIGGKAFDFTQAALARRWAAGHEQTRRALDSVA